jgi:hypothetical protein
LRASSVVFPHNKFAFALRAAMAPRTKFNLQLQRFQVRAPGDRFKAEAKRIFIESGEFSHTQADLAGPRIPVSCGLDPHSL